MTNDFIELIDWKILGNSVGDYLFAIAILLISWVALFAGRRLLIRQLFRLENKYSVTGLRFVNRLISSIHPVFFLWLSLYMGCQQLVLNKKFALVTDKLAAFVLIFQCTSLAAMAVSIFINRLKFGDSSSDGAQNSVKQNLIVLLKTAVWLGGILFLLSNLGVDVSTFVTGLGVGGIAVALAAQTILGDTFSSFSITIDKPFEVGDEIMVDQIRGIVESIGLKTTRVRSPSGELIVFSNSDLSRARIHNFQQQEERRISVKIGLVYDTPTSKIEQLPQQMAALFQKMEKAQLFRANFMEFGDSALIFEIVYSIKKPLHIQAPDIIHAVNLSIRKHFESENIQMAFPTRTLHIVK